MLNKVFYYFEKAVVILLLFTMVIIIAISSLELCINIFRAIITHNTENGFLFLDMQELMSLFSLILLVVIGLELFETVKFYLKKHIIQPDFILLVALTAIARKVIILDYSKSDQNLLFGISAVILSLSAGYFLLKKAKRSQKNKIEKNK